MSILSESLTIGLLLLIVFGALFFYLYSRVAYAEKRVGMIENILIDIKMNQEQQPVHVLPSIPPSVNFNTASFIPATEQSEFDEEIPTINEELVVDNSSSDEMYSNLLEEVHNTLDLSGTTVLSTTEESVDETTKLSVNYESMTKEELVEVAKQKGIRLTNRPGREKLLQLIRGNELMAVPEE